MIKTRRVDFSPDEFLAGIVGMKAIDIAVYWVICSLIYSSGGPIPETDSRLPRLMAERPTTIRKSVARLVASKKVTIEAGMLVVKRCESELNLVQIRSKSGVKASRIRWKSRCGFEQNQQVEKNSAKLSINHQPSTISDASPKLTEKPETDTTQLRRLAFEKTGMWPANWGPRPETPNATKPNETGHEQTAPEFDPVAEMPEFLRRRPEQSKNNDQKKPAAIA